MIEGARFSGIKNRKWCALRACPEGVMRWVPFGQSKNK